MVRSSQWPHRSTTDLELTDRAHYFYKRINFALISLEDQSIAATITMTTNNAAATHRQNDVLTVSLSKHLTGHPIDDVLDSNWRTADEATQQRFNNVGFDFDPTNVPRTLESLRDTLKRQEWDGVLLGWCLRGYAERTELFEEVANVVVDEIRSKPDTKLIFCTGPKDLYNATMRNFPS
jgi:hypothetical protein